MPAWLPTRYSAIAARLASFPMVMTPAWSRSSRPSSGRTGKSSQPRLGAQLTVALASSIRPGMAMPSPARTRPRPPRVAGSAARQASHICASARTLLAGPARCASNARRSW